MESPQSTDQRKLYHSKSFSVFSDSVKQGLYKAQALTSHSLQSNYQSPANDRHSRLINFKFSINGADNELPIGEHHSLVLLPENGAVESPLISFGRVYIDTTPLPADDYLEPNTQLTIRLDLSHVMQEMHEKGYFEDYRGNRIYKDDFKGVYVAGDSAPLNWDFESLPDQEGVKLENATGEGIFSVTLVLNQYSVRNFKLLKWEPVEDVSEYPQLSSGFKLIDALYNLSLEELKLDIRPDDTFMAGEQWHGVWTRDISYSIVLSLAAIAPQVSKKSLMAKVQNGRIIQDTGTGGSWPVSTDRTTWALAAWEIYLVTGEEDWLRQAHNIISNSVDEDLLVAYDEETSLFRGESSFLDWREQNYPAWMGSGGIYLSECLGTNAVHYSTYAILARMAERLGEPAERWQEQANKVKQGINNYLWEPDRGYYGQFLYGHAYLAKSSWAEALGESLCVLYDVADEEQKKQVVSNTPVTKFGVTSIYPQIPNVPPYHNQGVWPFVQAFWNWAAASVKNEQAVVHGLASLYRQAALFLTNKENFVANSGDHKGTVINSDRQLWSVAGNLAMVYRLFFGMHFNVEGIHLKPVIPQAYNDTRHLSNFSYRGATLSFQISGWGTEIAEITLDGNKLEKAFIPGDLQGAHRVEIRMANNNFPDAAFNLTVNHTVLPAPHLNFSDTTFYWEAVPGAAAYQLWRNGELLQTLSELHYPLGKEPDIYEEYAVAAVDERGWASFLSEPYILVAGNRVQLLQAEQFSAAAGLPFQGYSGEGFVELSKTENTTFSFGIEAPEEGHYLLDVRFSNGSGPVNTDNKAANRSLYVGEKYAGTLVMPQLGEEAWSVWEMSNPLRIYLNKGENKLQLRMMSWNENMNVLINRAMLDFIRVIRL